jgi:hypothetical protein
MASATFELFRQAIAAKKQVACTYQNRPRNLCPHILGYKDGEEKSLTFQFGGDSSEGLPPEGDWRCVFIDQVRNATLRDGPWHTGEVKGNRSQTCVDEIVIEVSY